MSDEPRKVDSVGRKPGTFATGYDPRRGRNGGRSSRLAEIQRMLDDEHRTVENMKEVFAQLKAMATEAVITRHTDEKGNTTESIKQPNPAFMALYLDRALGPVKSLISEEDLADAPDEVIEWLRQLN